MKLLFDQPKKIITQDAIAEQSIELSEIEVTALTDDLKSVSALINFSGMQKIITLWDKEAYVNIGDWTQQQANDRIIELL